MCMYVLNLYTVMSNKRELAEFRRQIHNLTRKQKRAAATTGAASSQTPHIATPTQRCEAQNHKALMVYVLGGHSIGVAVDFVLGRGWRPTKTKIHGACAWERSCARDSISKEIDKAFLEAPMSALVALTLDPLRHFEYDDLLYAHKYVMEHALFEWITHQNTCQGVAPCREQVLSQAIACISSEAPWKVRNRLVKLLSGSPRMQRKWLARYRKRWGAKLGVLRPQECVSVAGRQQKAGCKVKGERKYLPDFQANKQFLRVYFWGRKLSPALFILPFGGPKNGAV